MPVVRYRVQWDLGVLGELAGSHIDINYTTSSSSGQLTLGMDAIWDWWDLGVQGEPACKTFFKANVELVRVTAQDITVGGVGLVATDQRTGVPGTHAGTGESLPPSNAIVISWRTNVSSRRQRGRMFLPPPPETVTTPQGIIDATYVGDIGDCARALAVELEDPARVALPNTGADHVIYSTRSSEGPAAVFNVQRYLVGNRVDSQRLRLGVEQTYNEAT